MDLKNITQKQDELKNIIDFMESNSSIENKIINTDGLTLAEVFQALVQMLNGDLELLRKVLFHASVMVKNGMKIPKESRLTKEDINRILQSKENKITYNFVKNLPVLPNIKSTTVKKSRGI